MRPLGCDAPPASERLTVRTTSGNDVLAGRLTPGDTDRPGRSISLEVTIAAAELILGEHLAPSISLLASRFTRRSLLPEDFARRVSVSLHKCSTGAANFEKVQS
jgi:hypothetical protein